MSEQIVVIPNVLSRLSKLEEFFKAIPYDKLDANTKLLFDMSEVDFINPYGMLMLMLMGKYLFQQVNIPTFLINLNPEVYKYLERMDFFASNRKDERQRRVHWQPPDP